MKKSQLSEEQKRLDRRPAMIYTPMTIKAMRLAYNAHLGQVDYNNVPYIFHPCHLAEQMKDEITCSVALLHDVIEDTNITIEDLEKEFPPSVVEAVELLTYDETKDYFEYIIKIKTNPIARVVKLSDIDHNSDETRAIGSKLTKEELLFWKAKYQKAKALLDY